MRGTNVYHGELWPMDYTVQSLPFLPCEVIRIQLKPIDFRRKPLWMGVKQPVYFLRFGEGPNNFWASGHHQF